MKHETRLWPGFVFLGNRPRARIIHERTANNPG